MGHVCAVLSTPIAEEKDTEDECDTDGGGPGAMDGGYLGNGEDIVHGQSKRKDLGPFYDEIGDEEVDDTTTKSGGRDDDRSGKCREDENGKGDIGEEHLGSSEEHGNTQSRRKQGNLGLSCDKKR